MDKARMFMEKALEIAMRGVKKGNSPFGACIVKNGRVVALAHNTVLTKKDSTNHAEINAIRIACRKLKSHRLKGCTIYSTTEPCPMCFSAIHWAKADAIVYGTSIADVKKLGFSELNVSNRALKRLGPSDISISGRFMREECRELLGFWRAKAGKTY